MTSEKEFPNLLSGARFSFSWNDVISVGNDVPPRTCFSGEALAISTFIFYEIDWFVIESHQTMTIPLLSLCKGSGCMEKPNKDSLDNANEKVRCLFCCYMFRIS